MSRKEIDIMTLLIYKRFELKQKIDDDDIVDKLLFSKEVKDSISRDMGYTSNQSLYNIFTGLRDKKVLIGNKISQGLIPNITTDANNFQLILNFNITHEGQKREGNNK